MKEVARTFTETRTYTEWEPGDLVRLPEGHGNWEHGHGLPPGVYRVERFEPPMCAADDPIVFVEGHLHGLPSSCVVAPESAPAPAPQ
jgi:hypothetical protein